MDLCCDCEKELPFLQNYCKRCAEPLSSGQGTCGACLNAPVLNLNTTALFCYQSPVDQLIIDLKFKNNLVSAKILGELLGKYLYEYYQDKTKPEVIVPVPLHASRLRERGYNQALELARPVAKKLNIPIDRLSITRVKSTLPQMGLSAKKRRNNIKRAFNANDKFRYRHVALVDDVITTGNTIFELCRLLKTSGVKKVDMWCPAKANNKLIT